ncbi:hypothetical protein [Micromonospora zamorensis]|uniref:hypothetical protein n=1 Tax=Micromonospora zamorensis TaxID=709883 RepID=UPI0034026889
MGKTYLAQQVFDALANDHPGYWRPGLTPLWPPPDLQSVDRERKKLLPLVSERMDSEVPGFLWLATQAFSDRNPVETIFAELHRQLHRSIQEYQRQEKAGLFLFRVGKVAAGQVLETLQVAYDAFDVLKAVLASAKGVDDYAGQVSAAAGKALVSYRKAASALGIANRPALIVIDEAEHMSRDLARAVTTLCLPDRPANDSRIVPEQLTQTPPIPFVVVLLSRSSLAPDIHRSPYGVWLTEFSALGLPAMQISLKDLPNRTGRQLFDASLHDMDARDRRSLSSAMGLETASFISPLKLARLLAVVRQNWDPVSGFGTLDHDVLGAALVGETSAVDNVMSMLRGQPEGQLSLAVLRNLSPIGPKVPTVMVAIACRAFGDVTKAGTVVSNLLDTGAAVTLPRDGGDTFIRFDFDIFDSLAARRTEIEFATNCLTEFLVDWVADLAGPNELSTAYRPIMGFLQTVTERFPEAVLGSGGVLDRAGSRCTGFSANALSALRILLQPGLSDETLPSLTMIAAVATRAPQAFAVDVIYSYLAANGEWTVEGGLDELRPALDCLAEPDRSDLLIIADPDLYAPHRIVGLEGRHDARWQRSIRKLTVARVISGDLSVIDLLVEAGSFDLSSALGAARLLMDAGRFDEALDSLRSWHPVNWPAAVKYIRVLSHLGRQEEARSILEQWASFRREAAAQLAKADLDDSAAAEPPPAVVRRDEPKAPVPRFPFTEVKQLLADNAADAAAALARLHPVANPGEACLFADVVLAAESRASFGEIRRVLTEVSGQSVSVAARLAALDILENGQVNIAVRNGDRHRKNFDFTLLGMQLMLARRPELEFELLEKLRAWDRTLPDASWAKSHVWLFVAGRLGAIVRGRHDDQLSPEQWRSEISQMTHSLWPRREWRQLKLVLSGYLFSFIQNPGDTEPPAFPYHIFSQYEVLACVQGEYKSLQRRLRQRIARMIREGELDETHAERVRAWAPLTIIAKEPVGSAAPGERRPDADRKPRHRTQHILPPDEVVDQPTG